MICKDGVVIASEKTLDSPFVMEGSDKHIHQISQSIGAVIGFGKRDYDVGNWWLLARWPLCRWYGKRSHRPV